MQNDIITIKRGSAQWRELFHYCDPSILDKLNTEALYAKGDLSALLDPERPKVLVTGSREAEQEDEKTIKHIIRALAVNPARPVVISGLAVGSDTVVHTAALTMGVPTIAVLPCGLEAPVYPSRNTELANKITGRPGCALLTQFPGAQFPSAINCMLRLHTMTMLSDFAVIACSRKKGSSLVCARLLYDFGRKVFAVPGAISDIMHKGCNNLIHDHIAEILCDFNELESISVMRKSNE